MDKKYRLRASADYRRTRKEGHSWAHPLLVLYVLSNTLEHNRIGFSVSRRVGGAVVRNRAKRRMREAVRLFMDELDQGWDMVFIARAPISGAQFHLVRQAVEILLWRACLLRAADGSIHPYRIPKN